MNKCLVYLLFSVIIGKLFPKLTSSWQLLMLDVLPSLESNLLLWRKGETDSQSQGGKEGGQDFKFRFRFYKLRLTGW